MRRVAMSSTRLLPLGLAGLAALWLAMLLLGAKGLDRTILVGLYAGDFPWIALAAIALTKLGDWSVVIAITVAAAVVLLYRRRARAALVLLVAAFSGRALIVLQKAELARMRPQENLHLVEVHYLSFPSGHAANSMIAYLTMALLLVDDPQRRRWAIAGAVLLSVLIGISRVLVGVHWPSDVVAGWAFGLFWTLLVVGLSSRWERKLK